MIELQVVAKNYCVSREGSFMRIVDSDSYGCYEEIVEVFGTYQHLDEEKKSEVLRNLKKWISEQEESA